MMRTTVKASQVLACSVMLAGTAAIAVGAVSLWSAQPGFAADAKKSGGGWFSKDTKEPAADTAKPAAAAAPAAPAAGAAPPQLALLPRTKSRPWNSSRKRA